MREAVVLAWLTQLQGVVCACAQMYSVEIAPVRRAAQVGERKIKHFYRGERHKNYGDDVWSRGKAKAKAKSVTQGR